MKSLKNIFVFVLVMIAAAVALLMAHGYIKYSSALKKTPLPERVATLRERDNFCSIDEIPDIYIKAVVAVEDRRFYKHNGFDIIGTARALMTDIRQRKMAEGGSTISQQLAKNLYFPQDNTLERKVAEIMMAIHLENEYEKDELLELYFNCIYYGSGYYCIADAAEGYFGCTPSGMNSYQATLLAGVPNAPSAYSPKANLSLAHERQKKVLSAMVDCGYITESDRDGILASQER